MPLRPHGKNLILIRACNHEINCREGENYAIGIRLHLAAFHHKSVRLALSCSKISQLVPALYHIYILLASFVLFESPCFTSGGAVLFLAPSFPFLSSPMIMLSSP